MISVEGMSSSYEIDSKQEDIMKKLSIVLLAVLLVASLIISCDNSTKALADEIVEVRIGTDSGSRGLEAAVDLNDLNDTSFTWYYSARKVTEQDFNFGETDEAGVLLPATKIVAFSQGKWNFGLWAVKDGKKVYSGMATEVLITKKSDGTPTPVVIPVSPYTGDNGFIELSNVTIHAKTGLDSYKLVTPNYACIDGQEVNDFAGSLAKTEYGTGSHVIEVAYKGIDGVTYASETIYLTVYSGRTTTISGFVNEETGSAQITPESTVEIQGFVAVKKEAELTAVEVNVTPSMVGDKNTVVTFPANSFTNEKAADAVLTVNVKPIDSKFSVGAAGSSTAAAGIDISLLVNNQPVTDFNSQNVTIETYIEKGLSGVKVYYNGEVHDENPDYEPSTGKLTFTTTHFSEFYVGADTQATIGDASYCLLTTAFDASQSGDTIKLDRDVSVDSQIIVKGKTITLDLNGKEISEGETVNLGSGIIYIGNDGYLTINDTSAEKTGEINVTTTRKWVNNKGEVTAYPAVWADIVIYPENGKKAGLTINGGTFIAPFYPISGNGNDTAEGSTTITINGGTFSSTDGLCIYHPQNGTLTINGGRFEGQESAIEIRSGNLNIADGYFKASNIPTSTNPNGNGTTTDGSAIAVAQHTTKLPINVTISGGEFEGYSAFYQSNPQENNDDDIAKVKLSIIDGTFVTINGGTNAVYSENKKGFISGGTFSTDPSEYVPAYCMVTENGTYSVSKRTEGAVQIGDRYYEDFKSAITDAATGETLKLLSDVTVDNVLRFGQDIIIDLNGHTLNANAEFISNKNGSNHNITIKNGTVNVKDYSFWWNVFKNEVTINLEGLTVNAKNASAVFRTMPTSVSHKLTINADADTVIDGTFLAGDPTYSANEETPSVSNIVVNGVHVNCTTYTDATRLYGQYKNSKVFAEFNNCIFECTKGGYPVYCGAKPAENGTVSVKMTNCELISKNTGISNAIYGYNNGGIDVSLNNCTDKDGNAITVQ